LTSFMQGNTTSAALCFAPLGFTDFLQSTKRL